MQYQTSTDTMLNLDDKNLTSNIEMEPTDHLYSSSNVSSAYMLVFDGLNDYIANINVSLTEIQQTYSLNCSVNGSAEDINNSSSGCWENKTHGISSEGADVGSDKNCWALVLVAFPLLTVFGNILVIMSVARERTLQTVTNYFIVSLAVADLLVAGLVMPFAVYVLFNGTWALPGVVCDFYIAMDVTCSTSSIFNLVAISIDRYIAVTQPIKYAKHKNNRRVWLTIALVWVISMAIGSPIVLGLNNTPDRVADACLFYNSDFIIYSSLSSFYIPCIIMVFLYYNIFKALRKRALKQRLGRRPQPYQIASGTVIENAGARRLAETPLCAGAAGPAVVLAATGAPLAPVAVDEPATNTGSGSAEEDDDAVDDCQIIANDKSTEFILATVVEEAASISSVVATLASPAAPAAVADANGNNDSGYAASQPDTVSTIPDSSPRRSGLRHHAKRNGAPADTELKPISTISEQTSEASMGSKKERKASASARFTIYKVNKASRKKREKSSAKKERKATKTLAIVLGAFLICWVPFFTCNIMDATCSKLNLNCQPGVAAFLLTTWLGYMNSFVNPVIYTIFNPEFRKAFKKIMRIGA